MAINKSHPMRFTPEGLTDAYDSTNEFPGSCQLLQNFVFDQSNPEIITARPGVTRKAIFSVAGFLNPAAISIQIVIGTLCYGMIGTSRFAGKDEPFVFNLVTGTFLPLTGVTNATTPQTQPTTGDWTPPTMANVGTMVIVTHPGFAATANKFGWFDVTAPGAPVWHAGDTATNPLTTVPTAVANFNNRAYFAVNNQLQFTDILTNPPTRTNASQALVVGDQTIVNALAGLPVQTTSSGVVQALYVFKQTTQVWQVTGDSVLSTLALNYVSLTVGTAMPRSIALATSGLYFMAAGGPYFIDALGSLRPLTNSAQQSNPDIKVPFQNAQTPTRWAAAYGNSCYRICGPTVLKGVQTQNDYWFDELRRRWTGPHTFGYDCASPYGRDFILSSSNNPGILIFSQDEPNSSSVYTDLDSNYQCVMLSSTFPKTGDMLTKQVAESQIELEASLGLSQYTVQAQNEQGVVMGTVVMQVNYGGNKWGGFIWGDGTLWSRSILWGGGETWGDAAHFGSGNIWLSGAQIPSPYAVSWAAPLVFEKMQLQVSVQASQFVGVGTFYARYQQTGYMVPTSITVASIAGVTGFGAASGTGVGTGVGFGINGITVQDEGLPVGNIAGITTMDFVGAGVTATAVGPVATVTIPGASGGGGSPPAGPNLSFQFNNSGTFLGTAHVLWDTGLQSIDLDTGTGINMAAGVGSIAMGAGTFIQQGTPGCAILQGDSGTIQQGNTATFTQGDGLTWTTGINLNWTTNSGASVNFGPSSSFNFGVSGLLSFTTNGRIMADMTTATLSNRLTFQSTTVNGVTIFNVIPNGSGTTGGIALYNASDFSNHSRLAIQARTTGHILNSVNIGTGAIQPIQLAVNGSPVLTALTTLVAQVAAGFSRNVVSKTGNYTATANDSIIFADCTTGNLTITLPAANVDGAGFSCGLRIKRIDSSANSVTISRAGADTIDGGTTFVLGALQAADLESDGVSKWGIF
jgi:hypothetical protein